MFARVNKVLYFVFVLYDEIFERVSQFKFGITLTDYMTNSVDSYGVLNKFL